MSTCEIQYRTFECNKHRHQLSTIFQHTIREFFETLDTEDVYMSTSHSMIDHIINRNFVNTFHRQNVPDQLQHFHKQTGKN